MQKRIIVVGAGGFLGSNIIKKALSERACQNIVAVTLGVEEMIRRFGPIDKLEIHSENALFTEEVSLNKDDIIINCAYPRAMKGQDVAIGLNYVESVFRVAENTKVKGIVNISSQSVYDPLRECPAREEDIPCLLDEYAVGKYCMELLIRNICKDVPFTNIRLASLIGPGFNVRVPNKMIASALESGRISVVINKQHFGYLDVEDAVNGLLKLVSIDSHLWKDVYNLGSDQTYTLLEIAETVKAEMKSIRNIDVEIVRNENDKCLNTALNSTRIKSIINDYQNNTLAESVRKIIYSL